MNEYTPTTEEVLRGFSALRYKVDPRQEGESFAEWLSRISIVTVHSEMWSEDAARRWLAAHDAEVKAEAWDEGHDCTGPCPINPYRQEVTE